MSFRIITITATLMLALIVSCSVLKKDDAEKDVRVFLTTFQNSLKLSDTEILKQFDTQQSSQAILTAIRVLQNKDLKFIECTIAWTNVQVIIDEGGVRAILPISLNSKDLEYDYNRQSNIMMWLRQSKDSFVITQFEGEDFYNAYVSMKNEMEWSVSIKEMSENQKPIIARARELQEQYDTVVWYAKYDDSIYFYVANGDWDEAGYRDPQAEIPVVNMGLVDFNGNEVIPATYDLIGTIAFENANMVEIKKDGKTGIANILTKQRIEPQFDIVIPYNVDDVFSITKTDTTYGWLTYDFQYSEGFPNDDAKTFVMEYQFIPDQMKISANDQNICKIPAEDRLGYGVVIPPSHLTATGIFPRIIPSLVADGLAINAFVEYIETKKTFVQNVSDHVNALITTIKERYLEGREEFYTHHQLAFVNEKQDTLAFTENIWGNGEFEIQRIGNIIEIKAYIEDDSYYYDEEPDDRDYNLPQYSYFELGEDLSISSLSSNRNFIHTEFVKLDSSYITGSFLRYNSGTGNFEPTDFLSEETLTEMRNEILAIHGYQFADRSLVAKYEDYSWYSPEYSRLEEVIEHMSEIDKHNMQFLEVILGPVAEGTIM